ncbi:glycosyltransferase family 4 protein [Tistrella mobilis]|uniref:glycosyltransferase family 4 protein n=1 Tax=Tistrella mobilis TaxID=171437 RepID=UPI0035561FA9
MNTVINAAKSSGVDLALVLPPSERFQAANAGAISLCVRDFAKFSAYLPRLTVYGASVDQPYPGIPFRGLPTESRLGSRRMAYLLGLAKAFAADRPRYVEIYNRPEFVGWVRLMAPRAAISLYLCNDPQRMRRFRTLTERQAMLRRLDAVFCVSDFIRDRLLEGIDDLALAQRAITARFGFDLPAFDARVSALQPERENLILFVGRIVEEKGAELFVDAVARALGGRTGWRAVMVGADRPPVGHDARTAPVSPYETRVRARVASINHARQTPLIEMTGFMTQDEVLALYGRAAIAVVPSLWEEPLCRTAIEAMAMRCPLISTDRGGLRELVHGAAVVIEPTTSERLAALIGELADDPVRREMLARLGRSRLDADGYDIRKVAALMDRVRCRRLGLPDVEGVSSDSRHAT